MNNENQEQETKEERTGNFWQDKALPFFKSLQTDKIKRYYVIALALQLLFLLLQFLPIMTLAIKAEVDLFGGLKMETKTFSLFSFCKEESVLLVLFLFDLFLFLLSLKSTIPYFIRKTDKMKGGFFLAKLSVVFFLVFFFIVMNAATETVGETITQIEKYTEVEVKELFSINFTTVLYAIVGVIVLFVLFHLSVLVKAQRQEDKVNARVAEELQKKNEQGNIQ